MVDENHWVKACSRVYAVRVHACIRVPGSWAVYKVGEVRTACLMTLVPLSGAEKPTGLLRRSGCHAS